mgnify:CR=1 FL=1
MSKEELDIEINQLQTAWEKYHAKPREFVMPDLIRLVRARIERLALG